MTPARTTSGPRQTAPGRGSTGKTTSVVTVDRITPYQDLIPLALRLIWDIDGVVDVVNKLGQAKAAKPAKTA